MGPGGLGGGEPPVTSAYGPAGGADGGGGFGADIGGTAGALRGQPGARGGGGEGGGGGGAGHHHAPLRNRNRSRLWSAMSFGDMDSLQVRGCEGRA